jgi:putative PIN family toxin of toxin-antitoxin system
MPVASNSDAPPADGLTVVLDTNVVLAWLVFRDPAIAPLIDALERDQLDWLATESIVDEARHMVAHPSLARWATDREQVLAALSSRPRLVPAPTPPRAGWPRCSDADDQQFIDLAICHRTRWLLTRDRAVLKLRRRLAVHGVDVVTPEAWRATE